MRDKCCFQIKEYSLGIKNKIKNISVRNFFLESSQQASYMTDKMQLQHKSPSNKNKTIATLKNFAAILLKK